MGLLELDHGSTFLQERENGVRENEGVCGVPVGGFVSVRKERERACEERGENGVRF